MKKQNEKDIKHLEEAMMYNPIASVNDCTGYVNTIPETNTKAQNLSQMLNVPTSPRHKNKRNK